MSEVGIFSSRRFNMAGLEIEENGQVIPNGQIFYGGDYILNPEPGKYQLIIQHVRNGEYPKTIEILKKRIIKGLREFLKKSKKRKRKR